MEIWIWILFLMAIGSLWAACSNQDSHLVMGICFPMAMVLFGSVFFLANRLYGKHFTVVLKTRPDWLNDGLLKRMEVLSVISFGSFCVTSLFIGIGIWNWWLKPLLVEVEDQVPE